MLGLDSKKLPRKMRQPQRFHPRRVAADDFGFFQLLKWQLFFPVILVHLVSVLRSLMGEPG